MSVQKETAPGRSTESFQGLLGWDKLQVPPADHSYTKEGVQERLAAEVRWEGDAPLGSAVTFCLCTPAML